MNRISAPFTGLGGAAIIAAGLVAAAIAYQPTQPLVWMVAYLVLVTGVVQYALGAGQAKLATPLPTMRSVWGQWAVLNLGHAGVIAGTLAVSLGCVIAGTILYDFAMIWFLVTTRHAHSGWLLVGFRVLAVVMFLSSWVGVVISLVTQ